MFSSTSSLLPLEYSNTSSQLKRVYCNLLSHSLEYINEYKTSIIKYANLFLCKWNFQ